MKKTKKPYNPYDMGTWPKKKRLNVRLNKFELFTIDPHNCHLDIRFFYLQLKDDAQYISEHIMLGWAKKYEWAKTRKSTMFTSFSGR